MGRGNLLTGHNTTRAKDIFRAYNNKIFGLIRSKSVVEFTLTHCKYSYKYCYGETVS